MNKSFRSGKQKFLNFADTILVRVANDALRTA
jgi:hypothetical protein